MEPQIINRMPTRKHGDLEFEAGALASRHSISMAQARAIIDNCGHDLDCIDEHARRSKQAHYRGGPSDLPGLNTVEWRGEQTRSSL